MHGSTSNTYAHNTSFTFLVILDPLVLAVHQRSQGNPAFASWDPESASLMWHSVTTKGLTGTQKSIVYGHCSILLSLLHTVMYICWCVAVVSTLIVFSMRWHPSKLMGCNHHHKYSVTRPTARSWVFNSQSMGCKEWQEWGTQFPISLTTLSERWQRIQKNFKEFKNLVCLLNTFGDCRGGTSIRSAWDIQSIILTQCFSHPSTLSPCEIILIKVCHSLTDLLCAW